MAGRTARRPLSQGEVLNTPALPLPSAPDWQARHAEAVARGEAATGYPNLSALKADLARRAEGLALPDEVLGRWHAAQVAAITAHIERLAAALRAGEAMLGRDRGGPEWGPWWLLMARYMRAEESLVRAAQHLTCCPNHGVQGVTEEEWAAALGRPPAVEDYEALSVRGMLTGEGSTAWRRPCERCARRQLETDGARLWTAAREGAAS